MMMLSSPASAKSGFFTKMAEKVSEYQSQEIAKIKKLGIKNLEEDEKKLTKLIHKNFFKYDNHQYQYLKSKRLVGDNKLPNAAKIVNELVSIMEGTSGMTTRFKLVYKALKGLQGKKMLRPSDDTESESTNSREPDMPGDVNGGAFEVEPL